MKDAIDSLPVDRPVEAEGFANRKLIRPSLNRTDHNHAQASMGEHRDRERSERPERNERNDRPSGGAVFAGGENVAAMSERQLETYRLRKVGFVFQFFNLIPSLSALENLELPMLMAGLREDERRARAESLLDSVGLKAKGFKRPEELSGGEQQRVAVCLALVNDPPIILAASFVAREASTISTSQVKPFSPLPPPIVASTLPT